MSEGDWMTVNKVLPLAEPLTFSRKLDNLLSSYFFITHSFIHSFVQRAVSKLRAHNLVEFRKLCGIRWGKNILYFH